MITVTWYEAQVYEIIDAFRDSNGLHIAPGYWRATDADDPTEDCPEIAFDWEPEKDTIDDAGRYEHVLFAWSGELAERLSAVLTALLKKRAEMRAHV